jgi:hypothetical protein
MMVKNVRFTERFAHLTPAKWRKLIDREVERRARQGKLSPGDRGYKEPPLLSRPPDWLCPKCGKPMSPYGPLGPACTFECGFVHVVLLDFAEAGQVLNLSVREIADQVERGDLSVRFRVDSRDRILAVNVQVWQLMHIEL